MSAFKDILLRASAQITAQKVKHKDFSFMISRENAQARNKNNGIRKSVSQCFVPQPALAFDLDETLVHATPIKLDAPHFVIRVKRRRMYVQMRPGLKEFIAEISKMYDIYFFTSSLKEYADPIIDQIAPGTKQCRRLFRDSCKSRGGYFVKDLSILRRPLNQVMLVDDMEGSALNQPPNLIRIKPFYGESDDNVLLKQLLPALENLACASNVSKTYKKMVQMRMYPDLYSFH